MCLQHLSNVSHVISCVDGDYCKSAFYIFKANNHPYPLLRPRCQGLLSATVSLLILCEFSGHEVSY